MHITIKLFATFREGRFKVEEWELPEGTKAEEILRRLNIKSGEVAILLINGRDAAPDKTLNPGDIISLFPPVGGG